LIEPVADPLHGDEAIGLRAELEAQPRDVHVNRARAQFLAVLEAPRGFE
jgi:hypothetical protein